MNEAQEMILANQIVIMEAMINYFNNHKTNENIISCRNLELRTSKTNDFIKKKKIRSTQI